MAQRLEALATQGLLLRMEVEGIVGPAYAHPDRAGLLEEVASGGRTPMLTTLLSPFDPLVWDRQRARQLFDFDYVTEFYTPAPKRRYGYFTLPILHRGRLVGRLDPKAHRAEGVFEIKSIHLERAVTGSEDFIADLAACLQRLAAWHGTPDVVVRKSDPPKFAARLKAVL
jgi:uncharacterized protein YcaQ